MYNTHVPTVLKEKAMNWRTRLMVIHAETLEEVAAKADEWTVAQSSLYRKDFKTTIEGHEKPVPCSLGPSRGSWTMTIQFLELVTVEEKKAA